MPNIRSKMKSREVQAMVRPLIPDNEVSRWNPYCILVRSGGTNPEYVRLLVYRTNGNRLRQANTINIAKKHHVVWEMSAYYGKTPKSSFGVRLALAAEARDFFNILYRIEHKQQKITPEIMKSITIPSLKRRLIEACCMAAL
jgi:hypothetical protein